MADRSDLSGWDEEDAYWTTNYRTRPYASSGSQDYTHYRPAYRYGYDAASRFKDRSWDEVESDLSRSWNSYEHRGTSTWEQMKDAVRDAWERATGKSSSRSGY